MDRVGVLPLQRSPGATPDPLVLDPAKPPVGANVGQLALRTLVEPFPQLVAGTPLAWGYSRRTRTFQLRYSTAKVGGDGRFEAGAITKIATPRLIYKRPYAVHVQGGAIVSRPGAGILELAACPRARDISVQVLRSGRDRDSCRATQTAQLRSRTDRGQPAMSWRVSATRSGAENIAQ